MNNVLDMLLEAVEFGKVDRKTPYTPHLKDKDGSQELTAEALNAGIDPQKILESALIPAMDRVCKKFSEKTIYVPQMLMSAKAMGASMVQLRQYFASGDLKSKGTFIIGTVRGDLHDIGKNLVSMMVEGSGWSVIDLGVDVNSDRFTEALNKNPGATLGLSALLTTTMESMRQIVADIRATHKSTRIPVGGAPVTSEFWLIIGADHYSAAPQGAVDYLNALAI